MDTMRRSGTRRDGPIDRPGAGSSVTPCPEGPGTVRRGSYTENPIEGDALPAFVSAEVEGRATFTGMGPGPGSAR